VKLILIWSTYITSIFLLAPLVHPGNTILPRWIQPLGLVWLIGGLILSFKLSLK
jgi:hypothetical protein